MLFYKVKLPLISPEQWHFATFTTWPVPIHPWQATLILPGHILRDTRSGGEIYPRDARENTLGYVDEDSSLKATYGCLTHRFAENPSYDPTCAIEMRHRIPMDTIAPHHRNGFVLTTNGTTLIRGCVGLAERETVLQAGVYHIELEFPCSLHGKDWLLRTIFSRRINKTLNPEPARQPVNVTITDMLTESESSRPVREKLQQLDAVRKMRLQVGSLRQVHIPTARTNEQLHWLNLLWLGTIPPSIILAYWKRRLCQRKPRKTELKFTTSQYRCSWRWGDNLGSLTLSIRHKNLRLTEFKCTFNKTNFSSFTKCLEMNDDRVIFPIHKELAFQCTFNNTYFSTFTKCLEMNADRVIFPVHRELTFQ